MIGRVESYGESAPPLGIHHGLPNADYHASRGISNSGLGEIAKSPRHYYAWHLDPERPERPTKPGQLEGTLAHCAILEPDEFDNRYVVGPTINRSTKVWKEWCAAEKSGRFPIQAPQRETAFAQKESVWAIPDIAKALSKGEPEVSAFWKDERTGMLCRCRPDFVHEAGSGVVLIDVKTFSSSAPAEFARQIARKQYHRQAAFYSDGYECASGQKVVLAFVFVSVETEHPYAACAVMLDEDSLEAGRRQYRRLLDAYAACLESDEWPSYSSAIELVRLPNYALEE